MPFDGVSTPRIVPDVRDSIQAMRRLYRDCARSGTHLGGRYCVGGAFLRARYGDHACWPFPTASTLAMGLQGDNAALSRSKAIRFASEIIRDNDRGDFNAAWEVLAEALSYGRN